MIVHENTSSRNSKLYLDKAVHSSVNAEPTRTVSRFYFHKRCPFSFAIHTGEYKKFDETDNFALSIPQNLVRISSDLLPQFLHSVCYFFPRDSMLNILAGVARIRSIWNSFFPPFSFVLLASTISFPVLQSPWWSVLQREKMLQPNVYSASVNTRINRAVAIRAPTFSCCFVANLKR